MSPVKASEGVPVTFRARRRRFRRWEVSLALLLLSVSAVALSAHDLFLKLATFFVSPGASVNLLLLNGTFSTSENAVTRDRVKALSLLAPADAPRPESWVWHSTGDTTVVSLRVGGPGTYVIGVSTLPRVLSLSADEFNEYLAADGVPDILDARRRSGELNRPVRERYSKHVKTLLQAGAVRSAGLDSALGYPAEIVPLDNPYTLRPGQTFRFRVLVDGQPIANQYVLYGGRGPRGNRLAQRSLRTDQAGEGELVVGVGQWYVKFIHMARITSDSVDYESTWASLTFEIR